MLHQQRERDSLSVKIKKEISSICDLESLKILSEHLTENFIYFTMAGTSITLQNS
jgi:hypothetical protein